MIIVIAGIKRSGSTWLYNAIRLIVRKSVDPESQIWVGGQPFEMEVVRNKDISIVKIHPFHNTLYDEADYIFTSFRKLQFVRESLSKFSDNPAGLPWLSEQVVYLLQWNRKTDFLMHYEWIYDNPKWIIRQIIQVFLDDWRFPKLKDNQSFVDEVYSDLNSIKPPQKGQDPITLLFSNHITKEGPDNG